MNTVDKSKLSTLSLMTVYPKKNKKTSFSGYAEILMHAFVTSCLDNGSALLNEIPEQQLKKLQLL